MWSSSCVLDGRLLLEHVPQKWEPVLRQRTCSNKDVEQDDDSKKSHPAQGSRRTCMTTFTSFAELRACARGLPDGNPTAAQAIARREAELTKPPRSLGRLEEMVEWLGYWQGRNPPRLDRVDILVFAGNHGVTAQGVSAYPAEVTAQMVENFAAGGAAINQLARIADATLRVIALALDQPTADFTQAPAMDEAAFLAAVAAGAGAVASDADLVCLG